MEEDNALKRSRAIIASSLDWKQAHASFDDAVDGLKPELRGKRPEHYPHSPWELVEHIRLAQADLLEFMTNASYSAPKWPDTYWPAEPAPPTAKAWDETIAAVQRDRQSIKDLAMRPTLDITAAIPWGKGQTYLRTILVAVDHAAYHVGQLITVRILLGAWPPA